MRLRNVYNLNIIMFPLKFVWWPSSIMQILTFFSHGTCGRLSPPFGWLSLHQKLDKLYVWKNYGDRCINITQNNYSRLSEITQVIEIVISDKNNYSRLCKKCFHYLVEISSRAHQTPEVKKSFHGCIKEMFYL